MTSQKQIILIPGTESSSEKAFSGLAPLLARDYGVHPVDFQSDQELSADDQLEYYVDQVEAYVDSVVPAHSGIVVVGYSLGSLIAMRYAKRAGDRIQKLILLGAWARPTEPQRKRHNLWLDLYESSPSHAGALSNLLQHSPKYLNFIHEQQTPNASGILEPNSETRLRVIVNRDVESTKVAESLTISTLVINGTEDQKIPVYCAYDLLGCLKHAQLALIDAGHALLVERLGEVYGLTQDFIEDKLPAVPVLRSQRV